MGKNREVKRVEKSNYGARGHMTEGIFYLLLRQGK